MDKESELLSAGTLGQVLPAMRLSVTAFMSSGKRPPIPMGDPFVHFDPKRRGEAMALLERAAKGSRSNSVIIYVTTPEWAQ